MPGIVDSVAVPMSRTVTCSGASHQSEDGYAQSAGVIGFPVLGWVALAVLSSGAQTTKSEYVSYPSFWLCDTW